MGAFCILQYTQEYIVTLRVDTVQGWEMDLVILMGPFRLKIFCDSMIANVTFILLKIKMCVHFTIKAIKVYSFFSSILLLRAMINLLGQNKSISLCEEWKVCLAFTVVGMSHQVSITHLPSFTFY